MRPLVSIIVPAWNTQNYIGMTIESILNQSYKNLQIIIVNNGSTDETENIVREYTDDRIEIISLEENKGANYAREIGLNYSKGDYIQYLDSDDLLSNCKIENQLKYLIGKNSEIAFGDSVFFLDNENPLMKAAEPNNMFYYTSSDPISFILNLYGLNNRGGMIPIHAWLCPKDLLIKSGEWNPDLTVDDDGEYFCRVVLNSKKIHYVEDSSVFYRKYTSRKSLSKEQNLVAMRSTYLATDLKLQTCLSKGERIADVKKVFAKYYMELANIYWPEYPHLTKDALIKVKQLGGTDYIPYIGNRYLDQIKYIIGWRLAKCISWYKNNLFRKNVK
jgi:glycosyltransferase involved in cell wall biosynthesis